MDVKKGENTVQTQVHKQIGYCYRVVFDVDPSENVTVQYTVKTNDEDVSLHFIESVYRKTEEIGQEVCRVQTHGDYITRAGGA